MVSLDNYPTRDNLFARVPEIDIFRKYLGVWVDEDSFFTNPTRVDNNPTCNFHRKADGRLRMIDRAGYFRGDCIDLVMETNRIGYKQAIKLIWDDFNANTVTRAYGLDAIKELQNYHVRERAIFHIKRRPWDAKNYAFWEAYSIPTTSLRKFKVTPVEVLWVGPATYKQNEVYRWKDSDPAYAYDMGKGKWKVYFPMREKQRFLSNTNKLQGLDQLQKSDVLVITKSMKDIMVLDLFGIPSVAPHSEGIVIQEIDDMLMYYKAVYVFFDNDRPGMMGMVKYRQEGAQPLMIPMKYRKDYGIKDISDYMKFFKYEQTDKYLRDVRRTIGE